MSPDDVRGRVEAIATMRDDERMHAAEDRLHAEVLSAIALGIADDPAACALAALATLALDFHRWYA